MEIPNHLLPVFEISVNLIKETPRTIETVFYFALIMIENSKNFMVSLIKISLEISQTTFEMTIVSATKETMKRMINSTADIVPTFPVSSTHLCSPQTMHCKLYSSKFRCIYTSLPWYWQLISDPDQYLLYPLSVMIPNTVSDMPIGYLPLYWT